MSVDRRLFPAVALGGLLVLLAGCSTPAEPETERESPLSVYLNALYGGDLSEEQQQKQFEEQNRQREDLIATCMTKQGFEYIPNTSTAAVAFSSGDEWKPDDREWVSQYGYGIVNSPGRDEPVQPDQQMTDPNGKYVEGLSASEQAAYFEALYGVQPTAEEMTASGDDADDGTTYEYDWTTAGCSGSAQHEISGEDPLQAEEFATLNDALNTFWMESGQAPEFAAVEAEWVSCMDEAGQPGFTTQVDASNSINDKYNAFWQNASEAQPVSPDAPEVKKLGEEEIALALIDLDCREKVNFADRREDAQFAAEEKFIADHKSELEALKAAAEQARS